MSATENRTADDIYSQLKTLRYQLEQLSEQGRIVMSRDRYNKDHNDSAAATAEALAGLEQAIDSMAWMETLATVDGEYPALKD